MDIQPFYNDVISYESLYKSAVQCLTGVRWKSSTQMFELTKGLWVARLREQLLNGTYKSMGFFEFYINERGKQRFIQSVHISERTVQKSLVNNALRPIVEPLLIDDNTASRRGMGTAKALNRVIEHLNNHYKKHKTDGGILIMDLHDYFHSVDHEILINMYSEVIQDKKILNLLEYFIRCFKKGLGLGSEVSQTSAIFYANNIDHYVKDTLEIEEYARYMDDSYVMCGDINELRTIRDTIQQMYSDIGIEMNRRKTQIVRFNKCDFVYLKKRWHLSENGDVIIRPIKKVFKKRRQLLKKQKGLLDEGKIEMKSIRQGYNSWRGGLEKYNCQTQLHKMYQLYMSLFNQTPDGETIEDIAFRKNLYFYKRQFDSGKMTGEDIQKAYLEWRDNVEWRNECKPIIRKMNKIIMNLFGCSWNSLKNMIS